MSTSGLKSGYAFHSNANLHANCIPIAAPGALELVLLMVKSLTTAIEERPAIRLRYPQRQQRPRTCRSDWMANECLSA